jgi:hypothetical protein
MVWDGVNILVDEGGKEFWALVIKTLPQAYQGLPDGLIVDFWIFPLREGVLWRISAFTVLPAIRRNRFFPSRERREMAYFRR